MESSAPASTSNLIVAEVGGRHDIPAEIGCDWTHTSAEIFRGSCSENSPTSVSETDEDQVTPSGTLVGANLNLGGVARRKLSPDGYCRDEQRAKKQDELDLIIYTHIGNS